MQKSTNNIRPTNTAAVVVWFHPTPAQALHVLSYCHHVAHTIIVDNSPSDNHAMVDALFQDGHLSDAMREHISYLPLLENKGIATALNHGCRYALSLAPTTHTEPIAWILTMDQDSQWEETELAHYYDLCNQYDQIEQVGVFSPRQDYQHRRPNYPIAYEQKTAVMTSGCLLSSETFRQTGGFVDELFIDEVDNEYCYHCLRLQKQVVICNHAFLYHQLGEPVQIRLFGLFPKTYQAHAPFRYYYIVRNNLLLQRLYPEHRKYTKKRLRKMLKRVFLYERRNWAKSIYMCFRGWQDFRRNHFGPLSQN